MPVDHDKKVLFFHIPKTAGTSIEHMLGFRYHRDRIDDTLLNYENTCTRPAYQHFTPREVRDVFARQGRDGWGDYYKFTVVRNPYTRAVSTYNFTRNSRMIRDVCSKMGQLRGGVKSFYDFLCVANHAVQSNQDCEERYNQIPIMHHLRPQRHWFVDAGEYNDVFQFERLHECEAKIRSFLDPAVRGRGLPHLNASRTREKDVRSLYDRNNLYLLDATYGCDRRLGDITYPFMSDNETPSA